MCIVKTVFNVLILFLCSIFYFLEIFMAATTPQKGMLFPFISFFISVLLYIHFIYTNIYIYIYIHIYIYISLALSVDKQTRNYTEFIFFIIFGGTLQMIIFKRRHWLCTGGLGVENLWSSVVEKSYCRKTWYF